MNPEVLVGGYIEETFEVSAGAIGLVLANEPSSFDEYVSL